MNFAFRTFWVSAFLAVAVRTGGEPVAAPLPAAAPIVNTNEIRLNFRSAPLVSFLNYLSEAAGFIIDLRTEIKGKTTVWSNQPVTREEALDLLSSALDQNGYTAVHHGRTLTIYPKDEAKRRDLPVKSGSKPEAIPKTAEMVTQIIPVRYVSAVQLARDLQPLLPDNATLSANEGGNALLMTDTQMSIHRLAEIVNALDTALASVSSIHVFPLKFADAKALATVLKDVFQPQDTARSGSQTAGNAVNTFQMAGSQGDGSIAGSGAATATSGGKNQSVSKVVAVAEERSNSLVVSAASDQMQMIKGLVEHMDVNVQDVTELRVFRLLNADPDETASLLSDLFPEPTQNGNNTGSIQFGGADANTTSAQGVRFQKQTRVVAAADARSRSVIVSAARELMPQIGRIIAELDSNRARKQQVFVYDVPHSNAQSVQDILQSLFPAPTSSSAASASQSSRQQNSPGNQLNNRATQNQNQRGGQGTGNSGFGGVGGGASGGGGFGSGTP